MEKIFSPLEQDKYSPNYSFLALMNKTLVPLNRYSCPGVKSPLFRKTRELFCFRICLFDRCLLVFKLN